VHHRNFSQRYAFTFESSAGLKLIGTRHGEKLFETLVNKEDMVVAEDLGKYYRIPADSRDLRYESYFSLGNEKIDVVEEYNSHNTEQLNIEQTKELLLKLKEVQLELQK